MRKFAAALALLLLAAEAARSNDTTAELATGGLVFVRNDDVEMRSEDLFISTSEIRVRYRFFNRSAKDVTVLVAFPMPDVTNEEHSVAIPSEDPVNLLSFTTRVNDRQIKADVEQKVFADGVDRTALLRELGIPLAPHLKSTHTALDALPAARWDELVRLKLAVIDEYSSDRSGRMQKHLTARWQLRTTFYWQQTFAAQKETVIEHRYKPSVGSAVMTGLGAPHLSEDPSIQQMKAKYCIEPSIISRLDRARRATKGGETVPYDEQRIDYILKTGANWSGPIKDFRLVVDKGHADNLVSFCGDGVKKIGPTQFEMRKTNYTPEGNFSVLILKPLRP
jgi:hypothetical protein